MDERHDRFREILGGPPRNRVVAERLFYPRRRVPVVFGDRLRAGRRGLAAGQRQCTDSARRLYGPGISVHPHPAEIVR